MNSMNTRKTVEIDATNRAVGRVASEAAKALMGKDEPTFERHIDRGARVVIINAGKLKFTGKKFVQKDYKRHTMFPGGLKTMSLQTMFTADPALVVKHAVNGMLPKNKHRVEMLKRLTIKV